MSYEPNPTPREVDEAAADAKGDGKFASLTAALLARKGEAEPALEPFAHARVAASARQMGPNERHDLNRKEAPRYPRAVAFVPADDAPRLNPAPRGAAAQEEPRFAENCPRERIATSAKRAAVTFRMSVHDFLRLKLASAELETPSQDIIIDAVEAYLDAHGVERLDDCKCLKTAGDVCSSKTAAE